MNLNLSPETVQRPEAHSFFVEKSGPFQQTAPACWSELHQKMNNWPKGTPYLSFTSFYKLEPQMVYRAGVTVAQKPEILPDGFRYEKVSGGKYACFVLKGSYSQLPEACGLVFKRVAELGLKVRQTSFYLENYVNDPKTTTEDQLITEILIPIE